MTDTHSTATGTTDLSHICNDNYFNISIIIWKDYSTTVLLLKETLLSGSFTVYVKWKYHWSVMTVTKKKHKCYHSTVIIY